MDLKRGKTGKEGDCFLGAAQVSENGDINHVSIRISKNHLTCSGGFIDINQSTENVIFLTRMTTKEIHVDVNKGELQIKCEVKIRRFVKNMYEWI